MTSPELFSVDQVADRLGLHVKTVRNYVREGRLKAVRIGKQYRISREDLESLTGHPLPAPARETVSRERHTEVSSIVEVDAVSPDVANRLTNALVASANSRGGAGDPLRIHSVYDEQRARLKVILIGDLETTASLLRFINLYLAA